MNQALENQAKMRSIRQRLLNGTLSYSEAKAEAEPLIEAIYKQHKVIAKKYNKKAVKLSFASLMR